MDKIDMNVFDKIKQLKKYGKIKEPEKPSREFKHLTNTEVEDIERKINNLNLQNQIPKNNNNNNNNFQDISLLPFPTPSRPKVINSHLTTSELEVQKHNNNLIIRNNNTKETAIIGKYLDENKQVATAKFNVKTVSGTDPTINWEGTADKHAPGFGEKEKGLYIKTINDNKLTWGTTTMMNNELSHAQEAIDSRIYVSWESRDRPGVACIRIGSNSICFCGHGFVGHDKVVGKKYSTKCQSCKCRGFSYIPTMPEEIGDYWMPYQKTFSYKTFRVKCKCKHNWDEHNSDFACKKCGCYSFVSNFCCVVCDKFWQDHDNVYETESERMMSKKPVGIDFIPYSEVPEIYSAVYNNKNKPKQISGSDGIGNRGNTNRAIGKK